MHRVAHHLFSSETFDARTRVVRDAAEACTWLHAIDIVESIWD